jgi:hypothetical protein
MSTSSNVAVQYSALPSGKFTVRELMDIRRHHAGALAGGGTFSDELADDCHSVLVEGPDGRAITYGKQDGRYVATGDIATREVLGDEDTLAGLLSVVPTLTRAA